MQHVSGAWQSIRIASHMSSDEQRQRPDPVAVKCTELLERFARSGDRQGFEELAELAGPFLLRRASFELARCGSSIDENEVVQEALLNLFRYAHTFRPRVSHAFATWASRIVRNVVLRCLRKKRTLPTVSFDELDSIDVPDRSTGEPFRRLVEAEDRRELASSLSLYLRVYFGAYQGLTDLQRRILHRVEIQGRNYRDVSHELGMRVEAVKMVVYRARKRLTADMQRAAAG